MGTFKTVAVTGLALLGGWYLLNRFGGIAGVVNVVTSGDPVAAARVAFGAKAQADAAKAAALGGPKGLADAQASEAVRKS